MRRRMDDQHHENKSIMVSLLGKPNAGKSTLANCLLGFDLSIVSHKPQTTRNTFHCSFTVDKTEVILVDSPGVHSSGQEINLRMNGQAQMAASGADLNLILVDISRDDPEAEFKSFLKALEKNLSKSWVVFTKKDLMEDESKAEKLFEKFQVLLPNLEKYFFLSAKTDDNVHELVGALCDEAPFSPHLYPNGDVSNKNMRFFVAEYVREQAFKILKEELPYELAVTIDDYHDIRPKEDDKKPDLVAKISATILVNRVSQRAIVIGSKGSVIKKIGTAARKKVEALVGGKVGLQLHVKVSNKWFQNNYVLEELGLPRVQKSKRVWRKK